MKKPKRHSCKDPDTAVKTQTAYLTHSKELQLYHEIANNFVNRPSTDGTRLAQFLQLQRTLVTAGLVTALAVNQAGHLRFGQTNDARVARDDGLAQNASAAVGRHVQVSICTPLRFRRVGNVFRISGKEAGFLARQNCDRTGRKRFVVRIGKRKFRTTLLEVIRVCRLSVQILRRRTADVVGARRRTLAGRRQPMRLKQLGRPCVQAFVTEPSRARVTVVTLQA